MNCLQVVKEALPNGGLVVSGACPEFFLGGAQNPIFAIVPRFFCSSPYSSPL